MRYITNRDTLIYRGATFDRLAPHTKGFYVNTIAVDDPTQRVLATYGDNYSRLVALKRKYDPTNLFRRNANIDPTRAQPALIRALAQTASCTTE